MNEEPKNPAHGMPPMELPEDLEPVYSNLARISHTPSELTVDFCRLLPGQKRIPVLARILLSPVGAKLLLRALAPRLDLPEDYFDAKVKYGTSILRVLHYPPVPDDAPAGAVRSAAHEDINFLTMLVAAKGAGLQLLDRDGAWLPVETEPRNLIVDSGDMLERLTNGVIPSTTHRVVNPEGPNVSRYSMPFFMHPASDVSLKVLPSCEGARPPLPEITAGEFLAERLRAIGLAS